jgi:hypothetical protein
MGCGCQEHNLGSVKPPPRSVARHPISYGTGKRAVVATPAESHPVEHHAEGEWDFDIPSLPLSAQAPGDAGRGKDRRRPQARPDDGCAV